MRRAEIRFDAVLRAARVLTHGGSPAELHAYEREILHERVTDRLSEHDPAPGRRTAYGRRFGSKVRGK
jgi:hypothetical protein